VWPAGHAFAYLHPFEANAAGVKLIDVTDCINTNKNTTTPDMEQRHTRNACDDEKWDTRNVGPDTPSHAGRLSALCRLGVKVGTDSLTATQCEKLSAVLYQARDIMAENVIQVSEARVPCHTIPLNDTKPVICERFQYDPAKELKLESLCNDLLNAGIVKESTSLWNLPVFLTTKATGVAVS